MSDLMHVDSRGSEKSIRIVAEKTDPDTNHIHYSINCLSKSDFGSYTDLSDMFNSKRKLDDKFRVALLIPTGLGASVGGHAGDGGSTARLFASVCDELVTHPNVVNGCDFNEMTDNTMYVEGYTLSRYIMGQIGLQKPSQNRVLVVVDGSADPVYVTAAINVVNAARVSYGLNCPEIVVMKEPFTMTSTWSEEGRAVGEIDGIDRLLTILDRRHGSYDAVAITSLTHIPEEVRNHYYAKGGVNPWGGVESMLTHAVSHCFSVPCAHAPMMESQEVENLDFGVVDPRWASETVSLTYLPCVLKGLNKAPRIIESSSDVDCMVMPRRCFGIPTLAAHKRGIPIIAVEDKLEVGGIDCCDYVDAIRAKNYLEAAGIVSALRSGISIESLRRPIKSVKVERC